MGGPLGLAGIAAVDGAGGDGNAVSNIVRGEVAASVPGAYQLTHSDSQTLSDAGVDLDADDQSALSQVQL